MSLSHCFQSIVFFHDLLEVVVVLLSNFFDLECSFKWRILNSRVLRTAWRVFIAACWINSSMVRCIRSCSTRVCSEDWSALLDRVGRAYCCCCCSWSSVSASFSWRARLDERGDVAERERWSRAYCCWVRSFRWDSISWCWRWAFSFSFKACSSLTLNVCGRTFK